MPERYDTFPVVYLTPRKTAHSTGSLIYSVLVDPRRTLRTAR